jgi:DNA-binding MarR family transcriptional regulator
MPDPVSLSHHQALAAADQARMTELAQLANQVRDLELKLQTTRRQLDARLYYWHEDNIPVTALAAATGLSRETVYKAIDRYRAHRA